MTVPPSRPSRSTSMPPRKRRGRAIIVGTSRLLEDAAEQSDIRTTFVVNLLDAIGEVTMATAREPVAAVILTADAAARVADKATNALRRVDPSVRLLIALEDSNPARRELAAAFDGALYLPCSGRDFELAIHGESDRPAPSAPANVVPAAPPPPHSPPGITETSPWRQSASPHNGPIPLYSNPPQIPIAQPDSTNIPPAKPPTVTPTTTPIPTPRPRPHVQPAAAVSPAIAEALAASGTEVPRVNTTPPAARSAPVIEPAALTSIPPQPVATSTASAVSAALDLPECIQLAGFVPRTPGEEKPQNDHLGDVDLVEAVLTEPDGVSSHAMRLISQQTGWNDLQLIEGGSLAQNSGAAVEYAGRTFGRLMSELASPIELQPWADWLARWLTLDQAYREFRVRAFQDELTGAWNRRFFETFMHDAIEKNRQKRRPITLMVFDIDDFKLYNDRFGHHAGDEILRETVRLLNSVIRKGDRVCRIGGDEFVVILSDPAGPRETGSKAPETAEQIARRFQDQVCQMNFPKLGAEAPGPLTISAGLATYPWDGIDAESLLNHADQLALQSKRRGKNAITLGPGATAHCRGDHEPGD